MAKITISVNPRTGGSYFPREIRKAGFCGKIDGFLDLLTCLLVLPGSTLTDVERSLKIILDDVALRKEGAENMNSKVEDQEQLVEVVQGGPHPIFQKYTRAWLNEVTGYSKGYLCRVAIGKIPLSRSFMKRACLAVGETPAELFLLDAEGKQP